MGKRSQLNANAKQVYLALVKELEANGLKHMLELQHMHPRICFKFNGENHMVIFSGSPKHTGTQKSVAFLKRILSGQYQKIHRKT